MTQITDILNLHELNDMVSKRYVDVQEHPTLPLTIYNYSKGCMYDRVWNEVTEHCRGLIVENFTGRVVARGPRKFWNYGQPEATNFLLSADVLVTKKEDGSLGIAWEYKGHYGVATRGSFTSKQAEHATKKINTYEYKWLREAVRWGGSILTPIVEIVYPSNRVVLDYGNRDELMPLGEVSQDGLICVRGITGHKLMADADYMTLGEALALPIPDDEEGYVVDILGMEGTVLEHQKLKGETYKMLHAILTNTSGRKIWIQLAARALHTYIKDRRHWGSFVGGDPDDFEGVNVDVPFSEAIGDVPDEFLGWLDSKTAEIQQKVEDFLEESYRVADLLKDLTDRERYKVGGYFPQYREINKYLKGQPEYLLMRAWRDAYPDGNDLPFLVDEE